MSTPTITMPTLAEGASLRLNETHNPRDNCFITQVKGDKTKTAPPVDAVLVDHAVVTNDKGNDSLRCLFVVLKGKDLSGNDVTGKNIVTDMGLTPAAKDYTYANMRFMGFNFDDVDAFADAVAKNPSDPTLAERGLAVEKAFLSRMNDASTSGVGQKLLNVKVQEETFTPNNGGTPIVSRVVPLGGITQPAAKVATEDLMKRLGGSGFLASLVASKAGPPKKDFGDGAAKGAGGARNPTSPPPAVQGGPVRPDSDLPF